MKVFFKQCKKKNNQTIIITDRQLKQTNKQTGNLKLNLLLTYNTHTHTHILYLLIYVYIIYYDKTFLFI